ncbi:glutaredoxin family protein [Crenobacter cavernae]|uniref:Glutaredoxin family protein n=1 Tax=Crenobacter cavernae TaxID=2290923 RepID=A0A345Y7L0_9NEIS|nr:glutaredoxin family protein [Crenobacter cavernae]AXK39912.1 glutaredoxin family protein [Crenobacter cavernae]RXZ44282.1 glutaredoxin family protein [Crenobacter cavernae]
MTLTLYFREYCSLCHQMLAELKPWQERYGFALTVLDVDADPELEQRFNEWVPVLMDGGTEICHYHLDAARLAAHLGEIG